MAAKASVATRAFQGIRIEVDTSVSFDEVLNRLRGLMGNTSVPQIVALAKEPITQAEYVQKVQERFVGQSGFMLFHEIDHGGWLQKFGINRRTVRWILGNPLIAITMLRHDVTAGLFGPVEMLLVDQSEGRSSLTYVKPSSLMVVEGQSATAQRGKGTRRQVGRAGREGDNLAPR